MWEERIDVAYCGNLRVFPLILLSALSAARSASLPLAVHLVTMDLRERDGRFVPLGETERARLEEGIAARNGGSRAYLHDARELYLGRLSGGKNEENGYTPYAQCRLLLDALPLPRKVLYLDSDVMCCGDLAQLRTVAEGGWEFAAVPDVMGRFFFGRDYCNSGVMLLDLGEIGRTGLFLRACDLVRRRRFAFPDQSALNRLPARKLLLPRRFNEQRALRPDTVLKHFCRGVRFTPFFHVYNFKQWDVKRVHEVLHTRLFDGAYEDYARLSARYGLAPLAAFGVTS